MPASLRHIHTPGLNSGVCLIAVRQKSFASFRKPRIGLAPLVRPGMTG